MECKEKVAIVTGAAGKGMGRSIALTLAREGIVVAVNYLKNQEGAEAIASYIRDNGGKAITVQGNIYIKEDCEKLVNTTLDHFKKVDICVIGPGANWNPEDLKSLKSDKSLQDVNQEISPIYNLLPLVLNNMEKRKWGRIIGIASNMDIPSPSYSYNAAKSGRIEALKLAVKEAWRMGVTVNIIGRARLMKFQALKRHVLIAAKIKNGLTGIRFHHRTLQKVLYFYALIQQNILQAAYYHTYFNGGIYEHK